MFLLSAALIIHFVFSIFRLLFTRKAHVVCLLLASKYHLVKPNVILTKI